MKEALTLSWRNLWRNPRRTVITVGAIGLGLALFIVATAYTRGLVEFLLDATTGSWTGEAQIRSSAYVDSHEAVDFIEGGPDLLERARALPHVTAATPRVYGSGLATMGDRSARVEVVGINLDSERHVTNFREKLADGRWPIEPHEALIGVKLAALLELSVGDKLVLTAADVWSGDLEGKLVTIAGLVYSSNAYLDRQAVILPIQSAGELLGIPGRLHEIALTLDVPADDETAIRAALAPLGRHDLSLRPWQEVQKAMASAIELNARWLWTSVLAVFLIASFGIVNTMAMSFLERYHEFGILRAIGTRPSRLLGLVLAEAAFLGALGVLLGLIAGLIVYWPFSVYGLTIGGGEAHGVRFDRRIVFELDTAATVRLCLVFWSLTVLTALGTARRAARIQPIEALRHV
jgi:ABC-type lipoprotein release transport system permease subunit